MLAKVKQRASNGTGNLASSSSSSRTSATRNLVSYIEETLMIMEFVLLIGRLQVAGCATSDFQSELRVSDKEKEQVVCFCSDRMAKCLWFELEEELVKVVLSKHSI